jgi:hypothetical protein
MRDIGLRGRFSYGPAQNMPNDQPMDLDGLAKIKREWMPNDGLLTLGINSRNVSRSQPAARQRPARNRAERMGRCRALGLPITLHTSGPSPITCLTMRACWGQTCNSCIRC